VRRRDRTHRTGRTCPVLASAIVHLTSPHILLLTVRSTSHIVSFRCSTCSRVNSASAKRAEPRIRELRLSNSPVCLTDERRHIHDGIRREERFSRREKALVAEKVVAVIGATDNREAESCEP